MIDRKYQRFVFSFFMSLLMSCIMSLVISIHNVAFVGNIISVWLSDCAFAFTIVFPVIILVTPLVYKLISVVLKDE